ncbi:YlxR family protein [Williamsia sterculiae]|nr:YlxR family protein [Williamsia sterculiae]
MSTPTRTCIGCRRRDSAVRLLRLVAESDGHPRVVVDHRRTKPGRGAWLHPDAQCLRTAVRRKAFAPALRVGGLAVDTAELEREIATASSRTGSSEHEHTVKYPR